MDASSKLLRGFLRLLLVGALLAQAIIVQAHVHPARFAAQARTPVAGIAIGPAPREHIASADYCPLCREAAMAGHYSVPPPASFAAAPLAWFWFVAPVVGAFSLAQPPHGWLSRAPPQ